MEPAIVQRGVEDHHGIAIHSVECERDASAGMGGRQIEDPAVPANASLRKHPAQRLEAFYLFVGRPVKGQMDDAAAQSDGDRMSTVPGAQLAENALDVSLDGTGGSAEPVGSLLIS